ncbi:hydrolase [Cruoricaptor ignavus]|uniref:Hydrolase n=1 Tax=Cruoricaptor ignavus TaxID=1118202 RepID=A0A7M1T435_9FLAO|nr:isochorismate family cysteine hydrolase YcaC [Cruoricaptor ignavus]QOR74077.1 hydrolase [Cruoricaptor ignavus]
MFGSKKEPEELKPAVSETGAFQYQRLNKDHALVMFVDHQAGLLSLVRDIEPVEFKANIMALADLAEYFELPTILTASIQKGPNGPIMPELTEKFPKAKLIDRPGEINAWDNEDVVKAVEKTGRKQIIIAGIVTEVCVAFPTLSLLEAGYQVFVAVDASGTFNELTRNAAWLRMQNAGAQLVNWFAIANEMRRDWREDMPGYLELFKRNIPAYKPLVDSYLK